MIPQVRRHLTGKLLIGMFCVVLVGCTSATSRPTVGPNGDTPIAQATDTVLPITPTGQTTATAVPATATPIRHATATPVHHATPTPKPATPTPPQNPYPPHTGKLVLNDPLKNNSLGNQWDVVTQGTMSCGFTNGAYHVMAGDSQDFICAPEAPKLTLSNFTLQISLTAVQGDTMGIVFRLNQTALTGYLFYIDVQHGLYVLGKLNGANPIGLLVTNQSNAIHQGLNQTNVLAVVVMGSTINLYINHQLVAQGTDTQYSTGQLGIFATSTHGPADVVASNASAWQQ
jgi:eukaryotic-like serine/threonine-protein kinase